MGVTVTGLAELEADLERIVADGPKHWRPIVSKGALNIKLAWRRRWTPIGAPPHNAPHLARGVGYDTDEHGTRFRAEIGVARTNPQAPLAHFPEYGSVKNPPMPGGLPSLLEEEPRFVNAIADKAVALLEGRFDD